MTRAAAGATCLPVVVALVNTTGWMSVNGSATMLLWEAGWSGGEGLFAAARILSSIHATLRRAPPSPAVSLPR